MAKYEIVAYYEIAEYLVVEANSEKEAKEAVKNLADNRIISDLAGDYGALIEIDTIKKIGV